MVRMAIGGVLGGLVQWLVSLLFWGTPLAHIALHGVGDVPGAAVQTALAQSLTTSGSGTYLVPSPDTPQGAILHGRGPVALVHFNTAGFPASEASAMLGALVLSIVSILLIGLALYAIADRVRDFETRAKIVVLVTAATVLYFTLSAPVTMFFLPWAYFIYLAIAQAAGLIAGGLVLVRWFLPGEARTLH